MAELEGQSELGIMTDVPMEEQDSLLVLRDKNRHGRKSYVESLEDDHDSSTDPTTSVDSCKVDKKCTDREREDTSLQSASLSDGDDPGSARTKNRVTTLSAGLSMSDEEEVGVVLNSIPILVSSTDIRYKNDDAAVAINNTIGKEAFSLDLSMKLESDDIVETNESSEGKENAVEHASATPHRKELGERGVMQSKTPMAQRSSPQTIGASLPPPSPSMNGNRLKPPPLSLFNGVNARPSVAAARSFEDVACFGSRSPCSSSSINLRIHPPTQKVNSAPITKMPANAKDTNIGKMSPRKSQPTIEFGATNRGAFAARAAAKKERDAADYQGAIEAAKTAPVLPVDDLAPLERGSSFKISDEPVAQARTEVSMLGLGSSQPPKSEIFDVTLTSVETLANEKLHQKQSSVFGAATRDFDENFTLPPPEKKESSSTSKKVQEMIILRSDPDQEEQAIFESKLAEDPNGIAIRKINSSGKSQLRFVKCIGVSNSPAVSSKKRFSSAASIQSSMSLRSVGTRSANRSVGLSTTKKRLNLSKPSTTSHGASQSVVSATEDDTQSHTLLSSALCKRRRALTWGNKTKVAVAVEKFTCVKKGKSTDRTRRSASPATHLLSVLTDDLNISLDIEAPTQSDRDKFAKAFARFLSVPLLSESEIFEETVKASASVAAPAPCRNERRRKKTNMISSAHTAPDSMLYNHSNSSSSSVDASETTGLVGEIPSLLSPIQSFSMRDESKSFSMVEEDAEQPEGIETSEREKKSNQDFNHSDNAESNQAANHKNLATKVQAMAGFIDAVAPTIKESPHRGYMKDDDRSTVSSLTAGFEHEIVDELHQVIQELRNELEASRAEAGRAVKVAEQAIQSAESCNSNDWNSTVTHKAAEAAAQAQKRAAEAMSRQRLAEEKLAGERRAARFWREQAETAEQDAGVLQTRAATAEVQRENIFHSLELERKRAKENLTNARNSRNCQKQKQSAVAESDKDKCRRLEIELERAKLALVAKHDEKQSLQVQLHEVRAHKSEKKKLGIMSKKKKQDMVDDTSQYGRCNIGLFSATKGSTSLNGEFTDDLTADSVLSLKQKAMDLKMQFELFRSFTSDQLKQLPESGSHWGVHLMKVLTSAYSEKDWFKERLAAETSLRRNLSHQVLDYRGTVRVFCRPRPSGVEKTIKAVEVPSNQTLVLNKIRTLDGEIDCVPLGFEFDHVFRPDSSQREVYDEIENLVLDTLEGFSVCVIAYGQSLSGKSHTITGEGQRSEEKGICFIAIDEIFTISQKRSERYRDSFTLTMLEVEDERLHDMLQGTPTALKYGEPLTTEVETSRKKHDRMQVGDGLSVTSSSRMKLEIKSNIDGDTVVQGLISVPINSPEAVQRIWSECEKMREERPPEECYKAQSKTHAFYTIDVVSTNIATGLSTSGKLQFVDLAPADRVTFSGDNTAEGSNQRDLDYVNKSLNTLNAVVDAKRQFTRSVPFRNSTLTHLLRDPLEGDSKVLFMCCIKSDSEDFEQTRETLRFAAKIRKVAVGVATKRTFCLTGR